MKHKLMAKSVFYSGWIMASLVLPLSATSSHSQSNLAATQEAASYRPESITIAVDPTLATLPPHAQIKALAAKYQLSLKGQSLAEQQAKVSRYVIEQAARQQGVPADIALALSGYESNGWKMWHKVAERTPQRNLNLSPDGHLHSTDWGLMQVNDQAHPQAFPQAEHDLVFNVLYGLEYLSTLHQNSQGSLNLGFGSWDLTLAAYHLGHRPESDEIAYASSYIRRIRSYGKQHGLFNELLYTVQAGDTLGKIAAQQLDAFQRWPEILRKNPHLQGEPARIRAGQTLRIPA